MWALSDRLVITKLGSPCIPSTRPFDLGVITNVGLFNVPVVQQVVISPGLCEASAGNRFIFHSMASSMVHEPQVRISTRQKHSKGERLSASNGPGVRMGAIDPRKGIL